jgi:hypothetical protein
MGSYSGFNNRYRYKGVGEYQRWTQPKPRTPLQQADYDYNIAVGNVVHWEKKKEEAYEAYQAELAKANANKCECDLCPTCGKEK